MANEGTIDLESPDSILTQANIRTLLNKSTFLKLPPEYQFKLMGLLPQVDRMHGSKLRHSRLVPFDFTRFFQFFIYMNILFSRVFYCSLNNEFFAKSTQEWKDRLSEGNFTLENMAKTRADNEKDKQKTDPWKVQHFEPVWGIQKDFLNSVENMEEENTSLASKKKDSSKKQKRKNIILKDSTYQ